jgi:RHS repeat-associated protein
LPSAPLASQKKVDCAYDFQGRRIQKIVSTNSGSALMPAYTNKFVYDGWNLIATLNSSLSTLNLFTWGTDLGGSLQGAGGVGGLLSATVNSGATAGSYFYSFDGNGNVAALANASNGNLAAQYEYGPFGEVIRQTGPMAKVNPFRFSTKFQDDETALCYYGFRYYDSCLGWWLNRDFIEETGGISLYGFVGNDPIIQSDSDGLQYNPLPITNPGQCLTYTSEGHAYTDAHWIIDSHLKIDWSLFFKGQLKNFTSDKKMSYNRFGTDAWFHQNAYAFGNQPGGICNSDEDHGHNSSYVKSSVINNASDPVKLNCKCEVNYVVGAYSPKYTALGITVIGNVLNSSYKREDGIHKVPWPLNSYFRGYFSFAADTIISQETVILQPSETKVLYNIYDQIAHSGPTGSGFFEYVFGKCKCNKL